MIRLHLSIIDQPDIHVIHIETCFLGISTAYMMLRMMKRSVLLALSVSGIQVSQAALDAGTLLNVSMLVCLKWYITHTHTHVYIHTYIYKYNNKNDKGLLLGGNLAMENLQQN